jgi:hypothetical protein
VTTRKDPHAVALGRKGGRAKVPKGFAVNREALAKALESRKLICNCGECRTCRNREAMRRLRAGRANP